MRSTGVSSWENTSEKRAMAQVPVEAVYVLSKTEPGHLPIFIPHTLL